jgi:acetyl esterase
MNRRTRLLITFIRRLPRPDPPSPRYLAGLRRELPQPMARLLLGWVSRDVRLEDIRIPTSDGPLRARVYRRNGAAREPARLVVNFHGGGFVFGNLTTTDWLCGNLAARTGAVVVSVDYRLAPEHPAPAPFLDSWAATQWLVQHATEFGTDATQVTVMGESAGGNLAALVALAWRDRCRTQEAWPQLACQVLIYPATDLTLSSASIADLGDAPMLGRRQLDWYGRRYLPQGLPSSIAYDDPQVSPLFAPDHRDLAPALIIAAGRDPLRDDAVRYADALRKADVPTRLVTYPEAIHGFLSIPLFEPASREALDLIAAEVRTIGSQGSPDQDEPSDAGDALARGAATQRPLPPTPESSRQAS